MSLDPLPPSFVATRVSVHALAEHVLCVVRHEAVGRIGLVPVAGGIATPPMGSADRVVGVIGTEIVDRDRSREQRALVTTVRAAAELVGVSPGLSVSLWHPVTTLDPDGDLTVDPDALEALLGWFGFAALVLARFAAAVASDEDVPPPTLWPEHFDLATTVAGANFGASPGDDSSQVPYLYVGPHARPFPAAADGYWNAPYGAALAYPAIASVDTGVDFLLDGYHYVVADGRGTG